MQLRTDRDSWDCGRKLTRDLKQGPGTENTSPGIFRSMHPFNRSQEMLSAYVTYVVAPRVSFICLFGCAVAWRFGVREEGRLGHEPGRSRSVLASASVSSSV